MIKNEFINVCPACEAITGVADATYLQVAEDFIDMMSNPGHVWNANSLSMALTAVARGYEELKSLVHEQTAVNPWP